MKKKQEILRSNVGLSGGRNNGLIREKRIEKVRCGYLKKILKASQKQETGK